MYKWEDIIKVIGFIGSLLVLYSNFKGKVENSENRMTTIELKFDHIEKQVNNNISRLNDHETQQKAMIALVEKVNNLGNDMAELKADIKQLIMKG